MYSPVFITNGIKLSIFVGSLNLHGINSNLIEAHICALLVIIIVLDNIFDITKGHNVNVLFNPSGKRRHGHQSDD